MKEHTQRQEADGEKGGAQHCGPSLRRALQLIRPLGNIFIRSLGNMKSDNSESVYNFVEAIYMVGKTMRFPLRPTETYLFLFFFF